MSRQEVVVVVAVIVVVGAEEVVVAEVVVVLEISFMVAVVVSVVAVEVLVARVIATTARQPRLQRRRREEHGSNRGCCRNALSAAAREGPTFSALTSRPVLPMSVTTGRDGKRRAGPSREGPHAISRRLARLRVPALVVPIAIPTLHNIF